MPITDELWFEDDAANRIREFLLAVWGAETLDENLAWLAEIHDYLNHGYRVLSSREGGLPEILGHAPELAQSGDLPGLNPQRAIELKLAGDQDGELYRLTLTSFARSSIQSTSVR